MGLRVNRRVSAVNTRKAQPPEPHEWIPLVARHLRLSLGLLAYYLRCATPCHATACQPGLSSRYSYLYTLWVYGYLTYRHDPEISISEHMRGILAVHTQVPEVPLPSQIHVASRPSRPSRLSLHLFHHFFRFSPARLMHICMCRYHLMHLRVDFPVQWYLTSSPRSRICKAHAQPGMLTLDQRLESVPSVHLRVLVQDYTCEGFPVLV